MKESSVIVYDGQLRRNILPELGQTKVRDMDRGVIKHFLVGLRQRFSPAYTKQASATLSGLLNSAVDDGLLVANPMAGLSRKLKLGRSKGEHRDIKAFTREQRDLFLATAKCEASQFHYTQFLTLFMTGLRPGESFGLEWDDIDWSAGRFHVQRTVGEKTGKDGTPKTGLSRDVDMNRELADALRRWKVHQAEVALKGGSRTRPRRVFPTTQAKTAAEAARDAFKRVLKKAGLPGHFTPHCCRHSYASILLSENGSRLLYVQEQLGHASIQETVDTYGRWLRKDGSGAVESLSTSGFKLVVANR